MRIILATIAVAASITGAANACPPPPPPPLPIPDESSEAWQARVAAEAQASLVALQHQWWDASQSVLLARVERRDTVRLRDFDPNVEAPRVLLRPVHWLKGSGPSRRFRLTYTGMLSCGPYGGGEAVDGAVGEVFIVFVGEGRPRQESVFISLAPANVVDPELRERVAQATSAP